jgi:hypothetical protein
MPLRDACVAKCVAAKTATQHGCANVIDRLTRTIRDADTLNYEVTPGVPCHDSRELCERKAGEHVQREAVC